MDVVKIGYGTFNGSRSIRLAVDTYAQARELALIGKSKGWRVAYFANYELRAEWGGRGYEVVVVK